MYQNERSARLGPFWGLTTLRRARWVPRDVCSWYPFTFGRAPGTSGGRPVAGLIPELRQGAESVIRYRLDDLGWFHFEKLVQSLLKADLGLAVQSWGGSGDFGRDAFTKSRLAFPDRTTPTDGPFLFQAKFVQAANAAGANWRPSLVRAVKSEVTRLNRHRVHPIWNEPAFYVLITNCALTALSRTELDDELQRALPSTEITTLGGSDVCDLLDNHPALRRSFPELLSLRDLDLMLSEAVSKQILERSRAAVEESRDLVPVFVPTYAYHHAWDALERYAFVVLDGPPEMGKTAVARVLGLAHLFQDWQVIDCRGPGDFFSLYDDRRKQLFVADDAFGRTEYDPALGRLWERDLPRIFHRLGHRHRLVWTTRKHILVRALREMDLTGRASRFPSPGEVIVTADELSREEKARILYRHARSERLDHAARELVRINAVATVDNKHFTPERIRRFVREILPELAPKMAASLPTRQMLADEIAEAIRDPTERMRKSFRRLGDDHKWILISFLECDGPATPEALRERFAVHRAALPKGPFKELLDDLLGTFLKVPGHWPLDQVDWIHPSYRDLVIDELSADPTKQSALLRRMNVQGIKLALSTAGGPAGERSMPLLTTPEGWDALECRCEEIAAEMNDAEISALLAVLIDAVRGAQSVPNGYRSRIERALRSVCETAVRRWDASPREIATAALAAFFRAADELSPGPSPPRVDPSWDSSCEDLRIATNRGYLTNADAVAEWTELLDLLDARYPSFFEDERKRLERAEMEARIFDLAAEEVEYGASLQGPESNDSDALRLEQLAGSLSQLDRDGSRDALVGELFSLAQQYRDNGVPEYEADEYERPSGNQGDFDVDALFEDL